MKQSRLAAFLILLGCVAPLMGCGATSISTSLSVGDPPPGYYTSDTVLHSHIDGEFTGWDGDTYFPLENGQVWHQASYDYTYHYAYRPEVTIYPHNGTWYLQVEGLDEVLPVEQTQ